MQVQYLKFLKPLLVCILLLLISPISHAQTNSFGNHYIDYYSRIIPETPKAAAFKQYGDIPIDHSTGLPQISIPLYTVEVDGVKIPISLSYHASGIGVDELAGPVGLKWTLSAGGGIFRTVKELPDEGGWLVPAMKGYVKAYMDSNDLRSYLVHSTIRTHIQELDHSPDDFRYDVPGYSGTFFFDEAFVDSSGDTLSLEKKVLKDFMDPLKIIPFETGQRQISFRSYGPDGVVYFFGGAKEQNDHSVITGSDQGSASQTDWEYGITSWMLDSIVTKNGSVIRFEYEPYVLGYQLNQISQRINQSIYCDPNATNYYDESFCGCEGTGGLNGETHEYMHSTSKLFSSTNQLIKKIETENVRVDFLYETDNSVSTWKKKLTKITIVDKLESKQKSFDFAYDKFEGDPRLKLVAVQEKGYDNTTTKPPYEFSYEPGPLPVKASKSKDLKGFFNGKSNNSLVPFSAEANAILEDYYRGLLSDRTHDEDYLLRGVLNKITYPTGGTTEFAYEANANYDNLVGNPIFTYENVDLASNEPGVTTTIEGNYTVFQKEFTIANIISPSLVAYASASSICSYDPEFPNIDCSKYNVYQMNGPLIGDAIFPSDKIIGSSGETTLTPGTYLIKIRVLTSDLNTYPDAEISVNASWVEEEAQKIQYGGGLRVKSIVNYDNNMEPSMHTTYEYYGMNTDLELITYNTKHYGDEHKKTVFASENIAVDPIYKKAGYFYDSVVITKVGNGEMIRTVETYKEKAHRNKFQGQLDQKITYNESGIVELKKLFYAETVAKSIQFYTVGDVDKCIDYTNAPTGPAGVQLGFNDPKERVFYQKTNAVSAETTEHYFSDKPGKLVKTSNYTYNGYQQLLETTTTKSQRSGGTEENLKITFTYPDNYQELDYLVDSIYLVGMPVSKNVYNYNELIQGQYFKFDNAGNVTKTYRYTGLQQTLPSGTPAYVPQTYELNNEFEIEAGLPIQVTGRDDVSTVFIWSYNKQYPVAKIENATIAEVASALSVTQATLANYPTGSLSQLDNLRQSLPQAMVYTFTFRPQVGVVEMTDPNGQTTTYEYDDLGRLSDIIDSDNKLIQSFQYTYFNQN